MEKNIKEIRLCFEYRKPGDEDVHICDALTGIRYATLLRAANIFCTWNYAIIIYFNYPKYNVKVVRNTFEGIKIVAKLLTKAGYAVSPIAFKRPPIRKQL